MTHGNDFPQFLLLPFPYETHPWQVGCGGSEVKDRSGKTEKKWTRNIPPRTISPALCISLRWNCPCNRQTEDTRGEVTTEEKREYKNMKHMSESNLISKNPHMTFLLFIPFQSLVSFTAVNLFYWCAALFNLKNHPMDYKQEKRRGLKSLKFEIDFEITHYFSVDFSTWISDQTKCTQYVF